MFVIFLCHGSSRRRSVVQEDCVEKAVLDQHKGEILLKQFPTVKLEASVLYDTANTPSVFGIDLLLFVSLLDFCCVIWFHGVEWKTPLKCHLYTSFKSV